MKADRGLWDYWNSTCIKGVARTLDLRDWIENRELITCYRFSDTVLERATGS
jgi:hypothetical protein